MPSSTCEKGKQKQKVETDYFSDSRNRPCIGPHLAGAVIMLPLVDCSGDCYSLISYPGDEGGQLRVAVHSALRSLLRASVVIQFRSFSPACPVWRPRARTVVR